MNRNKSTVGTPQTDASIPAAKSRKDATIPAGAPQEAAGATPAGASQEAAGATPAGMPQKNALQEIPMGSTAQIMIELYKSALRNEYPELKGEVTLDDSIIKRFTVLDAKTTQTMTRVITPDIIAESREAINVNLSRISEAARQRGPQSAVMTDAHNMYKKQFDELVVRTKTTDAQRDELLKRYRTLVQGQREAIADLIQRRGSGNISVADIEQMLTSFEKDVARFVREKTILTTDYSRAQNQTASLVEATRTGITGPGQQAPEHK